ncbi:hypothetical protein [Streptomyces sp. NBC_00439]|uniref:hypothetical protein n=1 Tax=Streptomyces sp. NBC_00439 TaxID=2903650 RepID=UPI00225380B8|nr:hypothetical protein [Streptomyces sp. NBC_00439]MCX5106971.1 hypothetical protein [Streptomyces sp. NBC_00439]
MTTQPTLPELAEAAARSAYDAATQAAGRKAGDPQRAEWLAESAAYVAAAQALVAAAGIAQ